MSMNPTAAEVKAICEQYGIGIYEARDYLIRQKLIADLSWTRPSSIIAALKFLLEKPNLNDR